MIYKTLLGLAELGAGIALAVPAFDPLPRFHRWAAAERRHDPNDLAATFVTRHVPSFVPHRGIVVDVLLTLGLLKVVAAAAMFYGREWGAYLLLGVVALALPFDVTSAIVHPSAAHAAFAVINIGVLTFLAALLRRRRRVETV